MHRTLSSPARRALLLDGLALLGGGAGVLSLLGTVGSLTRSQTLAAAPLSGYRALVCVYLAGGNDALNMVVPSDSAGYAQYLAARQLLAIPQAALLPINPLHGDGHQYGLHPSMPELQALFQAHRMAVVANVGPLLVPTTQAMVRAGVNLPPQLFSHEDQTRHWMTGRPDSPTTLGWGGLLADLLQAVAGGGSLPALNVSMAGNNIFQTGAAVLPYGIDPVDGVQAIEQLQGGAPGRSAAMRALMAQGATDPSLLVQQHVGLLAQTDSAGATLSALLPSAHVFGTAFPASPLGAQLHQVARMISLQASLGISRQIFFVQMGGFDTHSNQLDAQPALMATLSKSLAAFYAATAELGVQDAVTTFTLSDFGRTLTSNNAGTDHGWGAHHLVLGGAVNGGDIYGTMPDLSLNGPDDADGLGRLIPTTSVSQYAAALGGWLGASPADLASLFPNLGLFPAGIPALLRA